MRLFVLLLILALAFPSAYSPALENPSGAAEAAKGLDALGRDFWAWRALQQPFSHDDIPRIERPVEWTPDWSPATVARWREELRRFEKRHGAIDPSRWTVAQQVDYRLTGSAIARVRWELDILRSWRRNPTFYVQQTLGLIFDRILEPPPFDRSRSREIVLRMQSIPRTLDQARVNLDEARAPFARLTIAELADVRQRLTVFASEIKPRLTPENAAQLEPAVEAAITALEGYRAWLVERLPGMQEETAVGRGAYEFFLANVALVPFTPEELLAMGRQEWERAMAFEAYEERRNAGLPELELFPDQAAQIAGEEKDEHDIRRYLEAKDLLTVPAWMGHYRNLPMPAYLEPLAFLGVTADHTSPARLGKDGVSYIWPPAPTLGYFGLSTARDPRPIVVHEGVPGHFFQLTLSWAHPNPIRRHYYDSGANEGLGFYAEEMMLQAGLFDDRPRTREILYNFMRLRALRVEVDVKLAMGEFSIEEAGAYLEKTVPMDSATAHEEAAWFAAGPGQAITYQIGKLQIVRFLADARRVQGRMFRLRDFHDFLWLNGNVPISLQRWEYLGLTDEMERLQRFTDSHKRPAAAGHAGKDLRKPEEN